MNLPSNPDVEEREYKPKDAGNNSDNAGDADLETREPIKAYRTSF